MRTEMLSVNIVHDTMLVTYDTNSSFYPTDRSAPCVEKPWISGHIGLLHVKTFSVNDFYCKSVRYTRFFLLEYSNRDKVIRKHG